MRHALSPRDHGLVTCACCGSLFLFRDGEPVPAEEDAVQPCPLIPKPHRAEWDPAMTTPFGPPLAALRRGKVEFIRSANGAWYYRAPELGWTAWMPIIGGANG